MIEKIKKLLENNGQNHILPFLWLHGEDEETLREYMGAINSCGIGAVCVESRPHPDFCGPGWWHDMNIILEEAKSRNMKVWILDDSHFPTGYANGALENGPEELLRQGICCYSTKVRDSVISLDINNILGRANDINYPINNNASADSNKAFLEDKLLSITAIRTDIQKNTEIDLTEKVNKGMLISKLPYGEWMISVCKLSRNCGIHRNYINMMDEKSCRVLIDTVYESHYSHYSSEFGNTIAGFFSDEPELGNGGLFVFDNVLGTNQDLPWSMSLKEKLKEALGTKWKNKLPYLWENCFNENETARVRYIFMDAVTRLVEKSFSHQIGNWCKEHGVQYIGHVIEDSNQHARTGASLGHYFRGLSGQDMAGIDAVSRQIMPQAEDEPHTLILPYIKRDGEFYHYVLAKLGTSLAYINPKMGGRTMCEIFGNYGWAEGFRTEKYLADHFMVRGVNTFVPHAFSAKEFPDPDCPPHFYAHGHNPQFRHFKSLMGYMNRVSDLISGGSRVVPAAILYHAEAEWTGKCMLMQKPARILADNQIDFDIIPVDVFNDKGLYNTNLENGFSINGHEYKILIVPYSQFVSKHLIEAVAKLKERGIKTVFIDALPSGIYDGDKQLIDWIKDCDVVILDDLKSYLIKREIPEIKITPENNRIRYMHYVGETDIFYFVNESAEIYKGKIIIPLLGALYVYNAWDNKIETIEYENKEGYTEISITLEPFKSMIIVKDEKEGFFAYEPVTKKLEKGKELVWEDVWKRSVCKSVDYPKFILKKKISLPDNLANEMPHFSGFVKYENSFTVNANKEYILVVTDAYEGVEVFVNNESAGIQVVPIYRFDITNFIVPGENHISIVVSTTLERERAYDKNISASEKLKTNKVLAPTGITGEVSLFEC